MIAPATAEESALVDPLVAHYAKHQGRVDTFLKQVLPPLQVPELTKLIHSIRFRVKDPGHLRDKLLRKKREETAEKPFDITTENLFLKINDLAGVRILHLHTTQIEKIDQALRTIIADESFGLVEGPRAKTWDDEYRAYFEKIKIDTEKSDTMYTSVHYVISSISKATVTCEIQVRTLMEEVWGEVDHTMNYPHPHESLPCREQIRALARSTSAATRLVDSIYATVEDFEEQKVAPKPKEAVAP
jgi:putative GTP pyrophosphokinase